MQVGSGTLETEKPGPGQASLPFTPSSAEPRGPGIQVLVVWGDQVHSAQLCPQGPMAGSLAQDPAGSSPSQPVVSCQRQRLCFYSSALSSLPCIYLFIACAEDQNSLPL